MAKFEAGGREAPAGPPGLVVRGVGVWPGFLGRPAQEAMLAEVLAVMEAAPPFHPVTRWGKAMSVSMTAAGRFGWFSDRRGYRYEERHPSGVPWPPIPDSVLRVWEAVAPGARAPECCLVNLYRGPARMGLHQDRDEADLAQPVVSISLGDEALFRVGGLERGGSTESVWLRSGDVAVIGGAARLVHHGIDRVREGSSDLVPGGGRINLTLRVVTGADPKEKACRPVPALRNRPRPGALWGRHLSAGARSMDQNQSTGSGQQDGNSQQSEHLQRRYKIREVTQYQASWVEQERGEEGKFTLQLILDNGVEEYILDVDGDDMEPLLRLLERSKHTTFDLERKVLMFSNLKA